MTAVLVTGASGSLGSRLLARLDQDDNEVLGLSRRPVIGARSVIEGSFADPAIHRQLDDETFDTAVHLAAVLDDTDEQACFDVNVLGTAALLRYLTERGCNHVVVASSIAATGCMSSTFFPTRIPINDDYPCEAVEAYGMSKGLMENLCEYFTRRYPRLEIEVLRIGVVRSENVPPTDDFLLEGSDRPFLLGGLVAADDVVDALMAAIEHPLGPGMHRFNVVGPTAPTRVGVLEALHAVFGDIADVQAEGCDRGREASSLYSTAAFERAYGLRLTRDVAQVGPSLVTGNSVTSETP